MSGNTVYAGGGFTSIGGQSRNRIAALDANTGLATGWNPGADIGVKALAVAGNTVYVGGGFTSIGGQSRNYIAAVDASTGLATGWNPDTNAGVATLAVSGSSIYAGGEFTVIGGASRNKIAALDSASGMAMDWNPGAGIYDTIHALAVSDTTVIAGGSFGYLPGARLTGSPWSNLALLPLADPCGDGVGLTTSPTPLWQMLALPCTPASATVAGAFGSGDTGNLLAANYPSNWAMYRFNPTVNAYAALTVSESISTGAGYWLKSLSPPIGNGPLTVSGAATPVSSGLDGCLAASGECVAATVSTVTGQSRKNLVGNPFPYAVDFANVVVQVTDGATVTTYTPSAAQSANILTNTFWIWNGTSYDSYSDSGPTQGSLQYFHSFWVEVRPGAFGKTVKLLIPSGVVSGQAESAAPIPGLAQTLPWYLGWVDWLAPPAAAAPVQGRAKREARQAAHKKALADGREWVVRLQVDNPATHWKDHNTLLGQLLDAETGYDAHDLLELAPFAKPYLTLVFPHPEWGLKAGDYGSDFRPAGGKKPTTWTFDLRSDPLQPVVLRWEGDPAVLQRCRLTDTVTGQTIRPTDPRWLRGYPVTPISVSQRFTWKYLGQ